MWEKKRCWDQTRTFRSSRATTSIIKLRIQLRTAQQPAVGMLFITRANWTEPKQRWIRQTSHSWEETFGVLKSLETGMEVHLPAGWRPSIQCWSNTALRIMVQSKSKLKDINSTHNLREFSHEEWTKLHEPRANRAQKTQWWNWLSFGGLKTFARTIFQIQIPPPPPFILILT